MTVSAKCLKVHYVPRTFSASGAAGETALIETISQTFFRGEEFFAFDTSSAPGRGTSVTAFVGSKRQFDGVPTWVFGEWLPPQDRGDYEAAAKLIGTQFETPEVRRAAFRSRAAKAAAKKSWDTLAPKMTLWLVIKFLETCKWEGVLWGSEAR